ncbi:MAG: NUDIX domain-containing protein [Aureispira sp.]
MHKGVGLIIGNTTKDLFFVQKKDQNYPITKWIDGFSFWGGAVEENDKSLYEALIRELQEELTTALDYPNIQFVKEFLVKSDRNYTFYLFELLVDETVLQRLQNQEVKEGNADLVTKTTLLTQNWIWGLEQVIFQYFNDTDYGTRN